MQRLKELIEPFLSLLGLLPPFAEKILSFESMHPAKN
jgi:hypothetical protein